MVNYEKVTIEGSETQSRYAMCLEILWTQSSHIFIKSAG